jgi:hypothetical protein
MQSVEVSQQVHIVGARDRKHFGIGSALNERKEVVADFFDALSDGYLKQLGACRCNVKDDRV